MLGVFASVPVIIGVGVTVGLPTLGIGVAIVPVLLTIAGLIGGLVAAARIYAQMGIAYRQYSRDYDQKQRSRNEQVGPILKPFRPIDSILQEAQEQGRSAQQKNKKPISSDNKQMRYDIQLEKHLTCPISQELFIDPVITSEGQTYTNQSFQGYYDHLDNKDNLKDPINKTPLQPYLFDNTNIKKITAILSPYKDNPEKENQEIPSKAIQKVQQHLRDPITGEIMKDPVVYRNGKSYERSTIERTVGDCDPKFFFTNFTLKNLIGFFREKGLLPAPVERQCADTQAPLVSTPPSMRSLSSSHGNLSLFSSSLSSLPEPKQPSPAASVDNDGSIYFTASEGEDSEYHSCPSHSLG